MAYLMIVIDATTYCHVRFKVLTAEMLAITGIRVAPHDSQGRPDFIFGIKKSKKKNV